jgi:UDP-N-acetylmuramyl pentapeptide phosphotransferase/UDP-N-acetylglucosamine-1-phosphate transferase
MRAVAFILIVAGILMLVLGNITYTRKEKVVDAGPIEINKKEKKTIEWPSYAGGVVIVAGVVILLVAGRKRN